MVIISVGAMNAAVKGGEQSLLDTLIAAGAVTEAAAEESGLLPDAYTRFVRELLAMEYTEVTIPFEGAGRNAISTNTLSPHVGQHDFYITHGAVGSTVSEETENMLHKALLNYSEKCMDGDYRNNDREDWGVTTMTMGTMQWPSCMLVTNRKGLVVGYALWEYGATEFTLRLCEKDSTALMDEMTGGTRAVLESLPCIEGTMDSIEGVWQYTFTDLPENVVWTIDPSIDYRYATAAYNGFRTTVKYEISLLYNETQRYPDRCVEAGSTFSMEPYYEVTKAGTMRSIFLFLDADYQPVAYAAITRKV